jgi:glycosyltransferase involved in cell wall biosynthesis
LASEFKVPKEKISVVPIFVETAWASQPVSWGNKNPGKFVFLAASRLVPIKNIGLQIEAMGRIVQKHPEAELWIAGDGSERENLELAASRTKATGQIKFLGWQADMRGLYAKADAFLLTSDAEGWPLVIIEAAANGLPIIMTNVGSADEFIKNWKNGIIIDPKDSAALEKAMVDLIENEDFRRRLGASARQSALELPSKKQILDLYRMNWEKVAKKKV